MVDIVTYAIKEKKENVLTSFAFYLTGLSNYDDVISRFSSRDLNCF